MWSCNTNIMPLIISKNKIEMFSNRLLFQLQKLLIFGNNKTIFQDYKNLQRNTCVFLYLLLDQKSFLVPQP